MDTLAETLASAAHMAPDGRGRLHARPALQSWPGIGHGGGVVALLAQSTSPPRKLAAPVARSRDRA